jgi:hypothetical protein
MTVNQLSLHREQTGAGCLTAEAPNGAQAQINYGTYPGDAWNVPPTVPMTV